MQLPIKLKETNSVESGLGWCFDSELLCEFLFTTIGDRTMKENR